MAAGTVATVAKKVLAMLSSDKKGRKFLGYVIGITIFIVFLPLLLLVGLFGWLSSGDVISLDKDVIYQNMPTSFNEELSRVNSVCEQISVKFSEKELTEDQISMAQSIYMSCLVGKEITETFYEDYARCFLEEAEEQSLFENISEAFDVTFTEKEIEYFNELYENKDSK